jgi:3-deoxy-D-manno-octulosonate 8-phosphate phosphatase (KDO 8-P phosphatase)
VDKVDPEVVERARRIRLILLDVDGVLTDGRIHLGGGEEDARAFYVRDGLGIRMGQEAGLSFGIVSGRRSEVVARRAAELKITEVHQGVLDKAEVFDGIVQKSGVSTESVCFVGDDVIDLPAMRRAGLAAAPSDADPETRRFAHYVTEREGGRGAVREVVDLVLRASGRWDDVMRRFIE